MKFIHTADLHIGATPEAGRPWARERAGAVALALPRVIELCNSEDADLLLISGDLFNRPPLKKDLREAAYQFSRLRRAHVVLTAGNHDHLSPGCDYASFDLGAHVHLIRSAAPDSIYFPELNTEVHGLSYYSASIKTPLYDRLTAPDDGRLHVLLAHGGDSDHIPISYSALSHSGFDYIALGHIHQPKVWKGVPMACCGSPEPLDPTDLGVRGCLSGEVTKDLFSLKWHPVATVQYREIVIELTPEFTEGMLRDRILERLREHPLDLFIVRLTGRRDPSFTPDLRAIRDLGRVSRAADETVCDYDLDALRSEHAGDMIGRYIAAFEGKTDALSEKALYYGLGALLRGDRS